MGVPSRQLEEQNIQVLVTARDFFLQSDILVHFNFYYKNPEETTQTLPYSYGGPVVVVSKVQGGGA